MGGSKGKRNLVAGLFVVVALAGACGSSDDGVTLPSSTEPEPTTTTEATTTTAVPTTTETTVVEMAIADMERPDLEIQTQWESDLDEIFGRYLLYWEAFYIAAGPPFADPEYAPLGELLAPEAVADIRASLQSHSAAETVMFRPEGSLDDHGLRLPNPAPLGKTEGNQVVIQDCWIEDSVVQTLEGDEVAEYLATSLRNVTMTVIDGEWKVFAVVVADDRSDGYQQCQDLFATLER